MSALVKVLAMDSFRPGFGGTYGVDYGPGTLWNIRYTIAQYKTMLKRRFTDPTWLLAGGPFTGWTVAPIYPGAPGTPSPIGAPEGDVASMGNGQVFDPGPLNTSFESEYPACGFKDGVGDPRKDAGIATTYAFTVSITVKFVRPHFAQDNWSDAINATGDDAGVWLPTIFLAANGLWQETYSCVPTEANPDIDDGELDGGDVLSNFLGIDDDASSILGITDYDDRIALGDGKTFAYLKDPGGDYRFLISAIDTTTGL